MLKRYLVRSSRSVILQVLISAGIITAFILLGVWIFSTKSWKFLSADSSLNIKLHASGQANYSRMSELGNISPVKLSLLFDLIQENNPDPTDINNRIAWIENSLKTPVPTITPNNLNQNNNQAGLSEKPTSSAASQTSQAAQNTLVPASPSPLPSSTLPALTNTPLPPTNTLLSPTNTSPPPTNSPLPPVPTENVCALIKATFGTVQDRQVRWVLTNNSSSNLIINSINISWPNSNNSLNKIKLNGSNIWAGNSPPPSASISSGWSGDPVKRNLTADSTANLDLIFIDPAESSGYNLQVSFSSGCSASASR